MSLLGNIQQQVADRLNADPFFENMTVLAEVIGDIENEYDRALGSLNAENGKVGAMVVVMTPDANQKFGELYGPYFDDIKISVQVMWDSKLALDPDCGVGVTDLDICEKICNILSQFYPAAATAPLKPRIPTLALLERVGFKTSRACNFTTEGAITTVPNTAATPIIVDNAGVISMSCATAGAAIFYTVNGRNPMPLNGTLYTGQFTPGAGITLKARAFLAGYLNSQIAIQTT